MKILNIAQEQELVMSENVTNICDDNITIQGNKRKIEEDIYERYVKINKPDEMILEGDERHYQMNEFQYLLQIKKQMMEGIQDVKQCSVKELEEIKEKQKQYEQELSNLKHENTSLKLRLVVVESKLEKEERRKKKLNVVIEGADFKNDNLIKGVESFFENELSVRAKVETVQEIHLENRHQRMVIARIRSWNEKQQIMINKAKLKGKGVYIDNDLTKKESEVQNKIRTMAQKAKAGGATVRIGYKKLNIDNVWWIWDDIDQNLVRQDDETKENDRREIRERYSRIITADDISEDVQGENCGNIVEVDQNLQKLGKEVEINKTQNPSTVQTENIQNNKGTEEDILKRHTNGFMNKEL